jgi:hypothetical protein
MHAAVLGNEDFWQNWSRALAHAGVSTMLCPRTEAEFSRADLIVAAEPEAHHALAMTSCMAIVVVTHALDALMCSSLACPGVLLLPPPSDDAARKLAAQWMVHHVRSRQSAAVDLEMHLAKNLKVDFQTRSLVSMGESTPLCSGEASLLRYLWLRRHGWTPTAQICREVFGRTDEAAAKLVWKYVSTLRKKLCSHADLLAMDRLLGYRLLPGASQESSFEAESRPLP